MMLNNWRSHFIAAELVVILLASAVFLAAQGLTAGAATAIRDGWHPWYEIKVDPDNSRSLIICGTKWDAAENAPFGFVYASSDGGATWQTALEDRASNWVTEQSCAFGSNHKAYFISEASKVTDGRVQHELGTTRLFVSNDSGAHWEEAIKTGWADYSTSAASFLSGRLFTFFNYWNTADQNKNWGSSIGLLVFSPNGKEVTGPVFDPKMQSRDYRGIFPSHAIALKSGAVVALYYGLNRFAEVSDLGIIRADGRTQPLLESTIISRRTADSSRNCDTLRDNSLTYDSEHNRLFVVYSTGCEDRSEMMLTSSDDEGKTWAKSTVLLGLQNPSERGYSPSLIVCRGGILGLLWEEGAERRSGRWLFSYIRDGRLDGSPFELARGSEKYEVSNDSLMTTVIQSNDTEGRNPYDPIGHDIALSVRSQLNAAWRVSGLTAVDNSILAIWSFGGSEGMHLYEKVLGPRGSISKADMSIDGKASSDPDVTRDVTLLYGGEQHFDTSSGILKVYVIIANRGNRPIWTPIKLEATDISSTIGSVSILNATNGLTSAGAIWDISDSITGGRIPPGTSSNPIGLSFHLEIPSTGMLHLKVDDLLLLKMRIVAR